MQNVLIRKYFLWIPSEASIKLKTLSALCGTKRFVFFSTSFKFYHRLLLISEYRPLTCWKAEWKRSGFFCRLPGREHRLINHKDTNPKFRLYRCFIEFIDLRYSQSCWYFRPALWTIAPLTFSPARAAPLSCVNNVHCCKERGEYGVIGAEGASAR